MKEKLWVLNIPFEDENAEVETFDNIPATYEFFEVCSLDKKISGNVNARLDDESGVKLNDFVYNKNKLMVVSDKIKKIYEKLDVSDIEYLPLQIFDAHGKIVDAIYWVLNILKTEPIIDLDKSELSFSSFDKNRIDDFILLKLVKDLDLSSKVFRPKQAPKFYIISDIVRKAFEEHGVTGYELYDADGWDGNTLSFEWDPS